MPRVISSLCLRDASCTTVCPVDCISPGKPQDQYPNYYIDAEACIDCGACETECPNSAIFEVDNLPKEYTARGGEIVSMPAETPGFTETYHGKDNKGDAVVLIAARTLDAGEIIDLTPAIAANLSFYTTGLGYSSQEK